MDGMAKASGRTLRRVFLGASLEQLVGLITEQGEEILRDAGVRFPSRAAPLMLLLLKNGPMSAADLAKSLQQPHQLVTQRVEALIDCKVISRSSDTLDARRKLLTITAHGKLQLGRLKTCLDKVEVIYAALFREIGCDLSQVVPKTLEALQQRTLRDRLRSAEGTATAKPAG
jgi:DNA-binding MarR family transcriptional regulator